MARQGRKSAGPAATKSGSPQHAHPVAPSRSPRYTAIIIAFIAGAGITSAVFLLARDARQSPAGRSAPMAQAPSPNIEAGLPRSHHDLLAMAPDELGSVDIATMNLLCAKGLPGAESLDVAAALKRLDDWAAKVNAETERHLYRLNDPQFADHYKRSEARLRTEFIVQVLQEDCGVHYNMERVRNVDFSNPKDMFILGMIDDANGGTCASMPVVYVAIGRRLGYPMKLALAKQHVYCRWEGETEKFNMDGAATGGLDFPPDEEYRKWPEPISDEEMASGEFLRGLSPQEELSAFMLNRGTVLHARGMISEAVACYAESHRLMPGAISPQVALVTAVRGRQMPGQSAQVAGRRPGAPIDMAAHGLPADPDPTPKIPMPGGWTPPKFGNRPTLGSQAPVPGAPNLNPRKR